jgi:glycyl-tRNA synthetase alpha chain
LDLQDIIFKLDRYWTRQGCALLPPGGAAGPNFAGPLCLAGAACRKGLPSDGLSGLYRYRILLRPAPAAARKLFLDSLRAAGLDRAEHDLRWLASEDGRGPGWVVLLDGAPLARFTYLPAGKGFAAEMELGLERLALVSQKKRAISELAWSGKLTYGELHEGAGS